MSHTFKVGDHVQYKTGRLGLLVNAIVTERHRNGQLTIEARFYTDVDGYADRPFSNYLGYTFTLPPSRLQPRKVYEGGEQRVATP